MHATTNEERGHSLEREQGEAYRRVWREEKEDVYDIIILAQKINKIIKFLGRTRVHK